MPKAAERPIRVRNFNKAIIGVLSRTRYQTASIIAAQLDMPPEAVARNRRRSQVGGYGGVSSTAKTNLIAQKLYSMVSRKVRPLVERRKNACGVFEYRLTRHGVSNCSESHTTQECGSSSQNKSGALCAAERAGDVLLRRLKTETLVLQDSIEGMAYRSITTYRAWLVGMECVRLDRSGDSLVWEWCGPESCTWADVQAYRKKMVRKTNKRCDDQASAQ